MSTCTTSPKPSLGRPKLLVSLSKRSLRKESNPRTKSDPRVSLDKDTRSTPTRTTSSSSSRRLIGSGGGCETRSNSSSNKPDPRRALFKDNTTAGPTTTRRGGLTRTLSEKSSQSTRPGLSRNVWQSMKSFRGGEKKKKNRHRLGGEDSDSESDSDSEVSVDYEEPTTTKVTVRVQSIAKSLDEDQQKRLCASLDGYHNNAGPESESPTSSLNITLAT